MRIIVTGNTFYDDSATIEEALRGVQVPESGTGIVLVHSGSEGAEAIAVKVARTLGWQVESHPADWDTHGRRAGRLRNEQMVDAGAGLVLAFPLGESPNITHLVEIASKAGIPVQVWESRAPGTRPV